MKRHGEIFGMVTVGERGQIVIPSGIRKEFRISPGDKLVAIAHPNTFGFVPTDEFNRFVGELSRAAKKFSPRKRTRKQPR